MHYSKGLRLYFSHGVTFHKEMVIVKKVKKVKSRKILDLQSFLKWRTMENNYILQYVLHESVSALAEVKNQLK